MCALGVPYLTPSEDEGDEEVDGQHEERRQGADRQGAPRHVDQPELARELRAREEDIRTPPTEALTSAKARLPGSQNECFCSCHQTGLGSVLPDGSSKDWK